MGRGRAKAKQTKVARELKYNSGGIDIDRLRADLGANGSGGSAGGAGRKTDDPEPDPYGAPDHHLDGTDDEVED